MIERVICYRAPTTVCDVDAIAEWLEERIDARVTVRNRFLDVHRTDELPRRLAAARVLSPYRRSTGTTMLGVRRYEERRLEDPTRGGGVLYDGLDVQRAFGAAIPPDEAALSTLHVPVTDRAIATWGEHDGRWHKRVNVLGQPALVSVPGLYEAPAKPEAYYREQQRYAMLSGDTPPREVLEETVEGEFLVENDPRTTETLKGYVLQAVAYLETGSPFCEDDRCRLANPHRQPGVIRAQLRDPEFCDRHADVYGN